MHPDWKIFLTAAGAVISNGRVVDFNDSKQAADDQCNTLCDLSHYALLAVQGDDAVKFLQGQLTNDVAKVDDLHSQLNAYCNNKGRMLANFRVFHSDSTYFISLPQELAEATLTKLQQYVLRSQVMMGNVSDALLCIGVCGEEAAAALTQHLGTLPTNTDEVAQFETAIVVRCAGDNRFECYATPDHMPAHWQALAESMTPVGAEQWELHNIRAGIPVITTATSEAFVPQMANMELINGVSFTKGCYTGQEIVARMHYLGKLKKRMYRISMASKTAVAAGTTLSAENAKASQAVGSIVSAVQTENGSIEALAVIQNSYVKEDKLKLGSPNGADVTVLDLPYSLESSEQKIS